MSSELEPRVTLPWLIKLRWLALGGQLAALGASHWYPVIGVHWLAFLAVSLATFGSNLVLAAASRRGLAGQAGTRAMGSVLALDTALLTALLAASGGPMNPFTVFYLVHITLSAVVSSAAFTLAVASLSVLGFGLLFLAPHDPHAFHRAAGLEHHLQGMWVAFVLAASFSAFFVRRVTQAIRAQRDQIASLREANARNARLASLTTLAAGAAHELGTPLGTIALAAHEALVLAHRLEHVPGIAEDLRLIELETERCRDILQRMTARARERDEQEDALTAEGLLRELRGHLSQDALERLELTLAGPAFTLRTSAGALAQSIAALVQNALEASGSEKRVDLSLRRDGGIVDIAVEDRGAGMRPGVLARVGEPFFTTKQPGHGLGLGVFLARAFVESSGGALAIEPRPGGGTRAVLTLPLARPRTS
jgi:two-component system sensor histidine kinase RegB